MKGQQIKIVIIGGNGFIGSHFTAEAVDRGHQVVVCELSDTPPRYAHGRPYELIEGGIDALISCFDDLSDVDIVCHFASSTTPATSNVNPARDIEENLVRNILLLEKMRSVGKKRILYLSSGGAIYGTPQYTPIDEEHPQCPLSSYGIVKGAMERYLELYSVLYGFQSAIVRPSNPYGPGQNLNSHVGVISTFLDCVRRRVPLTMYGNGSIIRDFVYVSDLVSLMIDIVEQGVCGTFNCGHGEGVSLRQLANIVSEVTGSKLEIHHEPARSFDPMIVLLDIKRAKERVGWVPSVTLVEGIRKTWDALIETERR